MQSTSLEQGERITTTLVITNRLQQGLAERGLMPLENVRTTTLKNVLVDTGATTVCLPADIIARLSLSFLKEVIVVGATGFIKTRIFEGAKISLCGREGTFECLELPSRTDALLGKIPLQALGIELDLQNQKLIVLPISPNASYLRI